MTDFDPREASIAQLQVAMRDGDISAIELVERFIARIEQFDQSGPTLNAIRALNPNALRYAEELDTERSAGSLRGPLHGIPVVVKDNYETFDMATTAGSKLLENFRTGRDATQIDRLRAAGAIILAKTNMHEFAYGITTCGSMFGQTKNPYDPGRNAGGSSGGTAAAVAANFATVGMGSDTCGSIRIPAAHNNLVGLRGTQGLASRHGIVPLSHTQDIGGPIGRCVADIASVLDVTVGFDEHDSQTARSQGKVPPSYLSGLQEATLEGKRIGILHNVLHADDVEPEVRAVLENAMQQLAEDLEVTGIDIPGIDQLLQDPMGGHLVLMEDFKWDIGDYLAAQPNAPVTTLQQIIDSHTCHPAVNGVVLASQATVSREGPDYQAALAQRTKIRESLLSAMSSNAVDVLVYPSISNLPVRLGEWNQPGSNCSYSARSGLPALALPAGFSTSGLPVGMELLGQEWSEARLLHLGAAIERKLHLRRAPNLS